MVKPGPEVIHDTSTIYSKMPSSVVGRQRHSFMSSNLSSMYEKPVSQVLKDESVDEQMDIMKILKEIEYLGSSHMTWKEKKEVENRKVVALGGKPPKKQRLPLSVAKPAMKNQKKREEKELEEAMALGRFVKRENKRTVSRKEEDQVLKASEGRFSNGILDVKHLLHSSSSKERQNVEGFARKGKRKGKGKGKGKKSRGKKRHN